MTTGNSVMTARPMASDLRQMPGPLVAVTPMAPPKLAPNWFRVKSGSVGPSKGERESSAALRTA